MSDHETPTPAAGHRPAGRDSERQQDPRDEGHLQRGVTPTGPAIGSQIKQQRAAAAATKASGEPVRPRAPWRFFLYSGIGVFMFFVPIPLRGETTIPLDHLVNAVTDLLGEVAQYVVLAIILGGAIYPFATGRWRQRRTSIVFALLNVVGLVAALMVVFDFGPAFLHDPDLGPFLYNALVISVGLIVPIGAIFLALLVGFGLMDWLGVLVRPLMRPVWQTPGRSAVDAVASFVGSYAVGLLITKRQYERGRYTAKEAAIIATGFSTVSATFMVIVARTLDLMDMWLWYFFLALVVTFAVTAITVRIPPLRTIPDECAPGVTPDPEPPVTTGRMTAAWRAAGAVLNEAQSLPRTVITTFREGLVLASQILPSIMSVGLIALSLAVFTPLFEWVGYIFLPFTWALQIPEPQLAATASALGVAEMFLPATLVAGAESEVLRLVIAIVSVSQVIFFSAVVPAILATGLPIKVWQMVVIWAQRVILSLIIATPLAYLVVMIT